jgi:hypothetical protein
MISKSLLKSTSTNGVKMKNVVKEISKSISVQIIIYMLSILFLVCYSSKAAAKESYTGISKTVFCMDVAMVSIRGYEVKQEKQKLVMFTNKTINIEMRKILNDALKIGYNSKSEKEAVDKSFKQCIDSKIWNENLQTVD